MVLEDWIMPYDTPNVILMDSYKMFISKFFFVLCAVFDTKLVTITEYHLRCNVQVERYNRTLS